MVRLGHSPDPDDAFMWWPLGTAGLEGGPAGAPVLEACIGTGRYAFRPIAADIQELNRRAIGVGDLEVSAMSMYAYGLVRDRYVLTDCGASFGDGYGPKVLVGGAGGGGVGWLGDVLAGGGRVAVPGFETSAYLVLRMMLGDVGARAFEEGRFVAMRFDGIVPAVLSGEVEAGLVIHEAQVTYAEEGLGLVVDLGAWWGEETGGLPMPLGANAVLRELDDRHGRGTVEEVALLLRGSVEHALAHRDAGLSYAERFATAGGAGGVGRALVDEFIGLYVNELTRSMGDRGRAGVEALLARAGEMGLMDAGGAGVEVVGVRGA